MGSKHACLVDDEPCAHGAKPAPAYGDIPFQAIVEQSLAGIYVLQDERLRYANETFARMLGHDVGAIIGLHLREFVPADFVGTVLDLYHRRIRGELTQVRFQSQVLHRDGHVVYIDVHGTRVAYRGRPAVVGVSVDVTERVRHEAELKLSQLRLQELAAHLNTVRESQRARFARELHDVLGGTLTSIKMDVKRILKRTQQADVQQIARDLMAVTQEAINSVKQLSEELRPAALDHLGLAAAIERELGVLGPRYSIATEFEADEGLEDLADECATGVYRILQEALTNVARHAHAAHVVVRLARVGEGLELTVCDDGVGIDCRSAATGHRSLGVLGMAERARELGGSLELMPAQPRGTRLRLCIPRVAPGPAA